MFFDYEFEEEDTIRMKNLKSVVCSNLKKDADFVPGPSNSSGRIQNFYKKEARYADWEEVDCVEQRRSRKPFDME